MYSVITNCLPYSTEEEKKLNIFGLLQKIETQDYRPKFTVNVKKPLKKLIERCWAPDPNSRPKFEEIFDKIALNKEDSFYDFSNDDSEEEEFTTHSKNKYFLDGVDTDEINEYIRYITKVDQQMQGNEKKSTRLRKMMTGGQKMLKKHHK